MQYLAKPDSQEVLKNITYDEDDCIMASHVYVKSWKGFLQGSLAKEGRQERSCYNGEHYEWYFCENSI